MQGLGKMANMKVIFAGGVAGSASCATRGGNVNKLKTLPPGCRLGDNAFAFVGGYRMWEPVTDTPPQARRALIGVPAKKTKTAKTTKSARR
jgi:hypothetical protein